MEPIDLMKTEQPNLPKVIKSGSFFVCKEFVRYSIVLVKFISNEIFTF